MEPGRWLALVHLGGVSTLLVTWARRLSSGAPNNVDDGMTLFQHARFLTAARLAGEPTVLGRLAGPPTGVAPVLVLVLVLEPLPTL